MGRTPPRMAGNGFPTPSLTTPLPLLHQDRHHGNAGVAGGPWAYRQEEEPRTNKNQDMATNWAKILRSAAKLLERVGAASKVCRANQSNAPMEESIVSEALVEVTTESKAPKTPKGNSIMTPNNSASVTRWFSALRSCRPRVKRANRQPQER